MDTHHNALTRLTDAAIATPWLLVKTGTDANHIAVTGVTDTPYGIVTDTAVAAEEVVPVELLGVSNRTFGGVASGAIAAGDDLVPGASGKVRKLPSTTGTYYIIGTALTASADGDGVEYAHCHPIQRIVA
jgi:hypothetical protein